VPGYSPCQNFRVAFPCHLQTRRASRPGITRSPDGSGRPSCARGARVESPAGWLPFRIALSVDGREEGGGGAPPPPARRLPSLAEVAVTVPRRRRSPSLVCASPDWFQGTPRTPRGASGRARTTGSSRCQRA